MTKTIFCTQSQINTALMSLSLTLLIGCAGQQTMPASGVPPESSGKVDDLLIVDCLLPGQIRQLGRNLTYLTPRRPIKASASECEIRGGEYTGYDRANFSTALKIWLPQAKDGNPQAQTYVGEIYEKGLGLKSDHVIAAQWYRKAADQGFSRAQINLGYLYESGLGVERDLTEAMNLYRAASGFDEAELEYVSSIEAANRVARQQELVDLQQQNKALESANAKLKQKRDVLNVERNDLTRLQSKIKEKRELLASFPLTTETQSPAAKNLILALAQLEDTTKKLDDTTTRQQQLISQLNEQQNETNQVRQQFAAANSGLSQKTQELNAREAEIKRLSARASLLESESARSQADTEEKAVLTARLAEESATAEQLSSELTRLRASQTDSSRVVEQKLQLAESKERVLKQQLDSEVAQVGSLQVQLADNQQKYNAELQTVQSKLGTARSEQARLGERLAEAELESTAKETELAALQMSNMELEQLATERRAEIDALVVQLADTQQQLETQQGTTAEKEQLAASMKLMQTKLTTARDEQRRLNERIMQSEFDALGQQERATLQLVSLEQQLQQKETLIEQQQSDIGNLRNQVSRISASIQDKDIEKVNSVVATGPTIEIIEPPVLVSRGKKPTLRSPAGIKELEVIGRIDPTDNLLTFKINGQKQVLNENGVFQHTISTKDVSSLQLVAVSDNGERTDLEFNVLGSALTPNKPDSAERAINSADIDFGDYHALIIGNNQYEGFHDLKSAENDAIAMERMFRERYGFKTELLLNATRYDILSALNRKRDSLTENDNLLIYYAGHGELSNSKGYWMPVDAEADNTSNWISNSSITDLVESMSAKHIMVVADSCYSGSLSRSSLTRLQPGMTMEKKLKWYSSVAKLKVRTVLTSGGVKPVLDSTGNSRHSLFAQALLDELGGAEGIVEAYDLFIKVQSRVKSEARKFNLDQNPQYSPIKHAGHESGEFLFVSNSRSTELGLSTSSQLSANALAPFETAAQAVALTVD